MHDRGDAKDHQRAGGHERRMQALRKADPVEHDDDQASPQDAEDAGQDRFLGERTEDVLPGFLACQQILDQQQGQQHGEGIVASGFDLERGADARAQPQAVRMGEEEDRRRIGRSDHGTDQQRLDPAEIERVFGRRRRQCGRQQALPRSPASGRARTRCERSRSACAGHRQRE